MKKIMLMTAACTAIALAAPAFAEGAKDAGKGPGKRFEAVDTNKDGFVDESEFLTRSKAAFKRSDTDGDGKLSEEERKAAREARKEKREERREGMKEKKEMRKEKREKAGEPAETTAQ